MQETDHIESHMLELFVDGELDAATRANKIWKGYLDDYEQPVIDSGRFEALQEYVCRRKASMPDRSY